MNKKLTDNYLWNYIKKNPIHFIKGNLILFRIGKKQHLLEMQQGFLHTRPLGYYAGLYPAELSKGQLDNMEGKVNIVQQFKIIDKEKIIGQVENVIQRVGAHTPILCFMRPKLTQTDLNKWKIIFDKNLIKDFTNSNPSNYGVLLIDGIKLKKRIEEFNIPCYGKMIEYTDKEFDINDGILNALFRKRSVFSYQQEFRIAFEGKLDLKESRKFPIGDISEFSRILPISILQDGLFIE